MHNLHDFLILPVALFLLWCRDPTSSHQVIQTVSCMRINKLKRDQRKSSDTERETQTQTSLEQQPSKGYGRMRSSPILTSSLYVSPTSAVSSVSSSVTSTLPTITTTSIQSSSSTLMSSSVTTSSISSLTLSSLTSSSVNKSNKERDYSANIGSKRFKSSGHKDSLDHSRCEFSKRSKVRVKREHVSEKRRHYRHHFETRRMSSKCTQTSNEKSERHRIRRQSVTSNTLDTTNIDKTVSTKKDCPLNPHVINASCLHSKSTDASSLNLPNDPDGTASSLIGSKKRIDVMEETKCENLASVPGASTQIESERVPDKQLEEAVNQPVESEDDDHQDQVESVRSVLSRYGRGLSTRRLSRSEVWNFTLGDDEINTSQVTLLLG